MNRIDVHSHFLPNIDDGCQSLAESLACLRTMAHNGYSRVFCTPHCGTSGFAELPPSEVAERVRMLQGHLDVAGIPIQLKPGGEIRLSPYLPTDLPESLVPTFGHSGKYALVDLWEDGWPDWAVKSVQWIQSRGHTVIIAHPERMPVLRENPDRIHELAALGVLFQGNLGPIGGNDSDAVVALAHRYLQEDRYFMVGTDCHRESHIGARLRGLQTIEELVGPEKLLELTVTNPARLWIAATEK